MTTPLFPGGVALSDLAVYDWLASDGTCGGSPHVHTASSEGYLVSAGSGRVQTLSRDGAADYSLTPGEVLWFSPGTVHRLMNESNLALTVVMQNSGLPEAGDAVLTFPAAVLDDPEAYAAAARLPAGREEERAAAARVRRDLAVAGYLELRDEMERNDRALAAFHDRAARLVRHRVREWQQLWESTVAAETERTRRQFVALSRGDRGIMADAAVVRAEPNPGPRAFGMCGRLATWQGF
ncbi:mannose-6-phosphate isomerase-like protein (cupin superfamily) [Microbacterium halimionae]|uniref:Mannose-6-phosphate isomerase-like protein (Cupin superfamily) n=1 Tax=Microbacterium halimionae TaxID=1526413 RepID=A0A7W3JQP5_9MICO|nr:cupin domain-containing protein [Microbacterium halimionae]MBA8817240.1 mannose-6-phosphate isomerase-like protein (cupin superfamily) [Microbacterium halimionae]NII94690.1 mannose-6-phosphate isomerase-like protein (cupin superfamily) [Microbacterium halimionae]